MSVGDLRGKRSMVTGAGSGMGRAAALALAREGAAVLLIGRRPDPLLRVQEEIERNGGQAAIFPADVTCAASAQAAVARAVALFGGLDLAFNNAGGHADFKPIDLTSDDEDDWVIDLNFRAVHRAVKYQVAHMRAAGQGGSIVNNASVFGLKAMPGIAHYVASKFAVVGLTRAVALECADAGIRINAVCPGGTETPNFLRVTGGHAHAMDAAVPMGRIAQPEEIAEAVVWLMSPRASYVTGTMLSVDGGMWAG